MYGPSCKNLKAVKNVDFTLTLTLPEEKPAIGKVAPMGVTIRPKQDFFLQYILFEVVNERTDKRAPMDRITSRSRYLYQHNIEKPITANSENKFSLPVRIPVHKEASRNDKFICIKWQITLQAVFKHSDEDKDLLAATGNLMEMEVV